MNTVVFYFSGTGNSLAIARELTKQLDGVVEVRPMTTGGTDLPLPTGLDRIGFVFPVYFQTIPEVVRRFVRKLDIRNNPYIFAVATCNGVPGFTLFALDKELKQKSASLSAGFSIEMSGNSLIVVDYMNPPAVQQERLHRAKARVAEVAETVRSRRSGIIAGDDSLKSHLESLCNASFVKWVYRLPQRFRVASSCVRCGACARICPAGNIRCDEKTGPRWGADCYHCLACFHWCPRSAIDLKQKMSTKGKKRYHHPEVTIGDMEFVKYSPPATCSRF